MKNKTYTKQNLQELSFPFDPTNNAQKGVERDDR